MPTIPSITTSIENHRMLVLDTHAQNSTFLRDKRNRLIRYSGGFTVVFPYTSKIGEKWAFRCWHSELGNVKRRFETISKAIQQANLPFLCDFVYNDTGINVEGKLYPTTRMRWVEGETLKKYICANYNSKSNILNLASQFLALIKHMHEHQLAHGDLQHGNILVGNDDKIYLVDYDSFYCQDLKGEMDIITGLKDYQHPSRAKNKCVSEKIDYFSELIIYISLLGIAHNPALCRKYDVENTERLLFEAKDFSDLSASQIYKDLQGLNPTINILLEILKLYCSKQSITELEPFDILLDRMTSPPTIRHFNYTPNQNLYEGDKITLTWDVTNTTTTCLNHSTIKSSRSERTVSAGNNNFTLTASNNFKTASETISIRAFAIPQIDLTASNLKLRIGCSEKTTLKWSIINAKEVYLEYNTISERVNSNEQITFCPNKTTTYQLKVIGLDGKRTFTKEITVGVYNEAQVSFTADKRKVISKCPVTLSWDVKNATKVELEGFGQTPPNGHQEVIPTKATDYILKVTDIFGTKEYPLRINTWDEPVIKFECKNKKLNKDKNEKAKISWKVSNATSVSLYINGNKQLIADNGTMIVDLDTTSTLKLIAIGLDGQTKYDKTLTINVFNQAKYQFGADRLYTLPDVPVLLTWDVEHAKKVELRGFGKVKSKDSLAVKTDTDTKYVLLVTDEFETYSKEVEVKMLPLPTIKTINVPSMELNNTLNVTVNVPAMKADIPYPNIKIPDIDITLPTGKSEDINNIFDAISEYKHPGLFSEIKSLFSHYYDKFKQW